MTDRAWLQAITAAGCLGDLDRIPNGLCTLTTTALTKFGQPTATALGIKIEDLQHLCRLKGRLMGARND